MYSRGYFVQLIWHRNQSSRLRNILIHVIGDEPPTNLQGVGPKHGNTRQVFYPFTMMQYLISNKGSRLNSIQKLYFKTMEPSIGFEPNIVHNMCLISIMEIHITHCQNWEPRVCMTLKLIPLIYKSSTLLKMTYI